MEFSVKETGWLFLYARRGLCLTQWIMRPLPSPPGGASTMQSIVELAARAASDPTQREDDAVDSEDSQRLARRKTNRVRWLQLNFTVKAARLQTLKRQKYQHLQEEALLKARGLLKNWENGVVVLTEDLYHRAAGERDAQELMNYTPEALALRFSLRNDPQVLEAVKELWQIEMPRDLMGCIDQRGYASVFRRIAKSLDAKAFRKKQRLDRLLNEDWKRDSKGEPTMSFANFFDSIFELADLWCETIDAEDYVFFLERLRDRISHRRNGRRIFKPMQKVVSFDAESSEEEEEEEETDDDSTEEEEKETERAKPPPVSVQPQILVAKAIRPTPLQQPMRTANLMQKVTRVAITSKPMTSRKEIAGSVTSRTSVATTLGSPAAVETGPERVPEPMPQPTGMALGEAASHLLHHQASVAPGMAPGRQRRTSVVTTLQFLDDGFVRSVSESINSGVGERASRPLSGATHNPAQVHVTMPRAMTSVAATAAAVAAFRRQRDAHTIRTPSTIVASTGYTPDNASDEKFSEHAERLHEDQREPANQAAGERSRVTTVSTAKRAMLRSIVLNRKQVGSWGDEGAGEDQLESEQAAVEPEKHSDALGREKPMESDIGHLEQPTTSEGTSQSTVNEPLRTADPMPRALHMRAGSVFGLDSPLGAFRGRGAAQKPVRTPKGVRVGIHDSAKLKARGLVPLGAPSASDGAVKTVGDAIHKYVAYANGSSGVGQRGPGAIASDASSTSGLSGLGAFSPDFSDSVVMTSYVVDRPTSTPTRTRPTRAMPSAATRKPSLPLPAPTENASAVAAADAAQHGVVQGTRALVTTTIEAIDLKVENHPETIQPRPMVVVIAKPHGAEKPQTTHQVLPVLDTSLGFAGHALHSVSDQEKHRVVIEGSPEQALHIKAALDPHRTAASHATGHVVVPQDVHTDASENTSSENTRSTNSQDHGLYIKPVEGRGSRQPPALPAYKTKRHAIDPIATPWDTSDEEDDHGIGTSEGEPSTRSLLRPESAMDALARVLHKRAAPSSAGSSHNKVSLKESSKVKQRPRRWPRPTQRHRDGSEDSEDEGRGTKSTRRSRVLTVSALGGSSVDSTSSARLSKQSRRTNDSNASSDDNSDEPNQGMRGSVSAPTLSGVTQLELDYVRTSAAGATTRAMTTSIQVPMIRPVQTSRVDNLRLTGGHMGVDLTSSLARSPLTSLAKQQSHKACSCVAKRLSDRAGDPSSWPPPAYRLEKHTDADDRGEVIGTVKCSYCLGLADGETATIVVNAQREMVLVPASKEAEIMAEATRARPKRSEIMRRRHRYTRGKPL